jgi:hypothetical protein
MGEGETIKQLLEENAQLKLDSELLKAKVSDFELIEAKTEVLTWRFKGIIVCDGWKSYARFPNRIQRCWAHLLRESKDIAEKFEEGIPLHNALK